MKEIVELGMKKTEIGDIFQLDPEKEEKLPGQFIVCTDIKEWGIQGYLLLDQPDNGSLVRFMGKAYYRSTWDKIVKVGHVEWIVEKNE